MSRKLLTGGLLASACVPAWAAGAGGAAPDGSALIDPSFGLSFWTLVTFVCLMFLLSRLAWKPLIGAIDEREQGIRETIEQAKSDREEAQRLIDETKQELQQARRERAEAVAAGQADAERLKEEILGEARKQREQLMAQTDERIQAEMRQARGELRTLAADYAILAAEKLLSKNLDDAGQRKLIEEYLSDLERPGGDSLPS